MPIQTTTTTTTATYILEKQHLDGPPTSYRVRTGRDGAVWDMRYPNEPEWGYRRPLTRDDAAAELHWMRRRARTEGGYRLYRPDRTYRVEYLGSDGWRPWACVSYRAQAEAIRDREWGSSVADNRVLPWRVVPVPAA